MENRDMNELWYENVTFTDKIELAKENLSNTVGSFVAAGYWIRSIWEDEECRKYGYETIWEMAEAVFDLKKSEASRAVGMNKKYSIGGNSPMILEKYNMYNKSQLQEMLTMTEEQLEKATVEMKVQELRQLKKIGATVEELEMLREVLNSYVCVAYADIFETYREQEREVIEIIKEQLERDVPVKCGNKVFFTGDDKDELVERITGEVLATYAPDVAVKMILEEYQKLNEIRQIKKKPDIHGLCDDAYCSECGCELNDPDCGLELSLICPGCGQAVDWSDYERNDINIMVSQQVNTESDGHFKEKEDIESVATSQEPVNTESDVLLEVEIIEEIEVQEEEIVEHLEFDELDDGEEEEITIIDGEFREIPVVESLQVAAVEDNGLIDIKKILESEQSLLNEYLKIEDLPEFTVKRQKIIVGALANMLCELEDMEEETKEQPELTVLKNNEQRQQFINNYESWPVWIEQSLTGERYYRYEFENGTAFVIKVYYHKCFDYNMRSVKWEDRYRDDWGAEEYYIVTDGKYFKDCLTNKSQMIEFLKNLQKGDK